MPELSLSNLAALPGCGDAESRGGRCGSHRRALLTQAIDEALASFMTMREREGLALAQDLEQRLAVIEQETARIAALAPLVVTEQRQRLEERLSELLGGVDIDQTRLANELAFFADKVDISEELTRLASHISQFRQSVASPGPQRTQAGVHPAGDAAGNQYDRLKIQRLEHQSGCH